MSLITSIPAGIENHHSLQLQLRQPDGTCKTETRHGYRMYHRGETLLVFRDGDAWSVVNDDSGCEVVRIKVDELPETDDVIEALAGRALR